jgi:DNA-binding SARP family transcriptional activator
MRRDSTVVAIGARATGFAVAPLHISLLGGFRIERANVALLDSAWQHRRAAKTLIKLLATHPAHGLHREQILELLWRDTPEDSAFNSFAKALHAARHALQPGLRSREESAYIKVKDRMLTLDTDHVRIDADQFQQLAGTALRLGHISAYETAITAYAGELLPEDRYEDWSTERRTFLAELHLQCLKGLASAFERQGAFSQAIDRLYAILQLDPAREDVHRRLMRIYAQTGARDEAVRQFHICRDTLKRELDMSPDRQTEALYRDVVADRLPKRNPSGQPWSGAGAGIDSAADAVELTGVDGGDWLAGQTAKSFGMLVDRLDRRGARNESAAAREKLAMALISMARYERARQVLKQSHDSYFATGDHAGVRRVAAELELVNALQAESRPERLPEDELQAGTTPY